MRHSLLFAGVAMLCVACSQKVAPITEAQLVGKWSCGPAPFREDIGGEVTLVTDIRADHTWQDFAKVTWWPGTEEKSGLLLTYRDGSEGSWRLDGDVIVYTTHKVEFFSSSNPAFGLQEWQAVVEPVPYTERERILSFDGKYLEMDEDTWLRKWSVKPWACWKL